MTLKDLDDNKSYAYVPVSELQKVGIVKFIKQNMCMLILKGGSVVEMGHDVLGGGVEVVLDPTIHEKQLAILDCHKCDYEIC